MKNIIRLAVLAFFFVACANPCATLRDIRSGTERGQPAVVAICACLATNPTAVVACQVEAIGYTITDAAITSAINTFCNPNAQGPVASPLQTRQDFGAWFAANGAVRK